MNCSSVQENVNSLGKLFESHRRINPDNLRKGYPEELKKRFINLLQSGVDKSELLKVTKISPPTLSIWISKYEKEDFGVPSPKELKIIEDEPEVKEETLGIKNKIEQYCAKLHANNGISIDLTEHGLLLSLKTLLVAV